MSAINYNVTGTAGSGQFRERRVMIISPTARDQIPTGVIRQLLQDNILVVSSVDPPVPLESEDPYEIERQRVKENRRHWKRDNKAHKAHFKKWVHNKPKVRV